MSADTGMTASTPANTQAGGHAQSALARHAKTIWMAVVLATMAGLFAASKLPVTLFPHIDYPRVVVAIDAGERDATQMAVDITRPA